MEEEANPKDGVEGTQDGVESSDKVAYESYQRALDETKKAKSESQKLKEELDNLKAQQVEKSGSKEEALETYKEQLEQLKKENESIKTTFAQKQINSKIENALTKRGCKNPDKALRVMDDKDYNALISDVDDNFNVGEQTMSFVLDKFQKENDFFFGKQAPSFADGVPKKDQEKPKSEKQVALEKIKNAKTEEEYKKALNESYKHFK